MLIELGQWQSALQTLGVSEVVGATEMTGGSSPAFRLDLADGEQLVVKTYPGVDHLMPGKDAFAATQLHELGVPVTRYLATDETREKLPFRFAVTNYLPGVAVAMLKDHPDIASVYRQVGALARQLHSVRMPAYGRFDAAGIVAPMRTHADFMRPLIAGAFDKFLQFGGDAVLAGRLRTMTDAQFDAVVGHSAGPVFAHDDLHPGNVLATEAADGTLSISGLIDFGNAHAADGVLDLAKCLFCSEHDAPGSRQHILAGYGEIDHPDPDGALAYYTTVHRVIMWWWLRHIGVIPTPDTPSGLIDALRATAKS